MTTLRQIELRCPVCDTEFKSQSVVSTNAFGGKRTDFHERAAGTQPLAYLIHMCSECGYSGAEADFKGAADLSPVLKQQIFRELTPRRPSFVSGSEKYEAAAKVARWQGMDSRYIADLPKRPKLKRKLKVVAACGNGTAGAFAPKVLEAIEPLNKQPVS